MNKKLLRTHVTLAVLAASSVCSAAGVDVSPDTAITPRGTPFTVLIAAGFTGDPNASIDVYESGHLVPGCGALRNWVGDFPDSSNLVTCALPASTPGWHAFDVVSRSGGSTGATQALLYVGEPVFATAIQLARTSTQPGGYQLFSGTLLSPAAPAYPASPDPTKLAPYASWSPPGSMRITLDGATFACSAFGSMDYDCLVPRQGSGRHTLAFAFSGAGAYANSAASITFANVAPRDDFDGNQRADIVWTNTAGRVALWTMDGTTQISGAELFAAGSGWTVKFIGEVQGRPGVVAMHADGRVQAQGVLLRGAASGWTPKVVADFDGDGVMDIVWEHTDGRVDMWLLDANMGVRGTAALVKELHSNWHPKLAADFDGNGTPDLLWQNDDGAVALWTMRGLVQLGGARLIVPGTGWVPVAAGYFDGDRNADIVWSHPDGRAALWLMSGATQIGGGLLLNVGSGFKPIAIGDLNGDGRSDIVWERGDGRTAYWLMDGARQVGAAEILAPGSGWKIVRLADYNGDGLPDYLAQHTDGRGAIGISDGAHFTQTTVLRPGTGYSPLVFPEQ